MLETDLTRPQQSSKPRITNSYASSVILVPLILGIMMTAAGISLMISDLGLIFFALGVVFLVVSFAASRQLSAFLYLPGESTVMALYVAVEFLAGAALVFVGFSNIVFDSEVFDSSLVAIAMFGLLLVSDSLLLYRRGFKQDLGKEKKV
ncbi:MAG: hypothetical protein KKE24_08165 [Candidatus Thermoplasmatota archaeon]|nr:hypothetical protein [Candidatus Thermoplasmatota archaeon]